MNTGSINPVTSINDDDELSLTYTVASGDDAQPLNVTTLSAPADALFDAAGNEADLTIPTDAELQDNVLLNIYGQTPTLLLGWIPLVNMLAGLWSLILPIIGLKELHKITTGRAILSLVVMLVVVGIVMAVVAAAFLATMFAMGGLGMPGMDMSQMLAVPY